MDQSRDQEKTIRAAAWALWAAAIVISLISLVFRTWNTRGLMAQFSGAEWLMEMLYWSVLIPLTVPAFATVGAWITTRLPRSPVGWLCLALALVVSLQDALWQYAMRALDLTPGSLPAGPWLPWFLALLSALEQPPLPFMLLLLRFPTGSLPSQRWRFIEWGVLGIAAVQVITSALLPTYTAGNYMTANPLGFTSPGWLTALTSLLNGPAGYLPLLLVLPAPYFHWRRADQKVRLQIKWLVYTSGLILLSAICAWISSLILPGNQYPAVILGAVAVGGITIGFPAAIGVAILKYRLYDIDHLINRTLVYILLTIGVIGAYVLVVGYLSALLQTQGGLFISLIATGLVAVLFQPLRGYLQNKVNRLMYGDRDDPYQVLTRLSQRLETVLIPEAVLPSIVETVANVLKLPYVAIELAGPSMPAPPAAAYPIGAAGHPPSHTHRLPLVYQKELVGYLVLAPRPSEEGFNRQEQTLLEAIGRQAGVAAHAVRLTSELQQSRKKLVSLREDERRRIRRDLHDGLGPQLAALNLQAGTIRTLLRQDIESAETAVIELRQEIQAAIADIRRLVYDLRPPSLDELGLVGAVQQQIQQAEKGGLSIQFQAPETLPVLSAAVEVAAYRIIQEALTNIIRHAQAQHGCVFLALTPATLPGQHDYLDIQVTDDGCGIRENKTRGVGLFSMRERAEELGGSCRMEPAKPHGTQIFARLPVFP